MKRTSSAQLMCLAIVCSMAVPAVADTIPAGYDYMQTLPGTYFNFPGVGNIPLLGRPIDPIHLGATDTIIQRLAPITFPPVGTTPYGGNPLDPGTPGTDVTIPIEIVGLSLHSVAPVNINGSYFDVFVDLDLSHRSLGQMHIDHRWNESGDYQGTFDSFFDVFFEISLRDLNGDLVQTIPWELQLGSQGTLWRHGPNGLDFTVREEHPGQGVHVAQTLTVPLPPAAWTGLAALIGLGGVRGCWRRKS